MDFNTTLVKVHPIQGIANNMDKIVFQYNPC